jgi:hypothetical protein
MVRAEVLSALGSSELVRDAILDCPVQMGQDGRWGVQDDVVDVQPYTVLSLQGLTALSSGGPQGDAEHGVAFETPPL